MKAKCIQEFELFDYEFKIGDTYDYFESRSGKHVTKSIGVEGRNRLIIWAKHYKTDYSQHFEIIEETMFTAESIDKLKENIANTEIPKIEVPQDLIEITIQAKRSNPLFTINMDEYEKLNLVEKGETLDRFQEWINKEAIKLFKS